MTNQEYFQYLFAHFVLPFSIKYKIHCEMWMATSFNPLVYEHVHIFPGNHKNRPGKR